MASNVSGFFDAICVLHNSSKIFTKFLINYASKRLRADIGVIDAGSVGIVATVITRNQSETIPIRDAQEF